MEGNTFYVSEFKNSALKLRNIDSSARKVFREIKESVGYRSGFSDIPLVAIVKATGLSKSTVVREIKNLVDKKCVIKTKVGRKNRYTIVETFFMAETFLDGTQGRDMAVDIKYVPKEMAKAIEALKAHTGHGEDFNFKDLVINIIDNRITNIDNRITNIDNRITFNEALTASVDATDTSTLESVIEARKLAAYEAVAKARAAIKLVK